MEDILNPQEGAEKNNANETNPNGEDKKETPEGNQQPDKNVENEAENPYADELKKAEKIMADRALGLKQAAKTEKELKQQLKDKEKALEELIPSLKDEILNEVKETFNKTREEMKQEMLESVNQEKVQSKIEQISSNEDEAKLIKIHFDALKGHPLYDTIDKRVAAAKALANPGVSYNEGLKKGREIEQENVMAGFVSSKSSGGYSGEAIDVETREAIKNVIGGNEKWAKAAEQMLKK